MKRAVLSLACAALACRSGATARDAQVPPAPGPTLAVYMPGGNIEDSTVVRGSWSPDEGLFVPAGQPSRWGAASDDLRELAEALRPPAVRARLSVWVAFGGARKAGWRGIRYADADCLVRDAEDQVFGNAPCPAFTDGEAELTRPETLAAFLAFVKARMRPGGTKALVLWGQGGAHEGLLYDTVHQEIPFMRLPQLRQALRQAAARFDVVGLDAPMMASLEALEVIGPFTRWVVAAPERAPGHGWDYRALVNTLLERDGDPLAIARGAAQSFMDGESLTLDGRGARQPVPHRESRAKMIGVVDAGKLGAVVASLERLVTAAKPDWPRLTTAFAQAPVLGRERKTGTAESADLAGVARRAAALSPRLEGPARELVRAIDDAVPVTRQDPQVLWPGKLTVFSPLADNLWRSGYDAAELLAPGWRAYLAAEVPRPTEDRRAPTVKLRRRTAEISDDRRVADVQLLRVERTGPELWRAVASSDAPVVAAAPDGRRRTVELPRWDGQVIWLCDGGCERRIAVSTHPEGRLGNGQAVVSAPVLVRDPARNTDGEDATLYLTLDGAEISDAWIAPIEIDTEARVMFSREQYPLREGLSIAVHALERDDPQLPAHWKAGPFFDLTAPPRWQRAPLGRKVSTLLVATDASHNQRYVPVTP